MGKAWGKVWVEVRAGLGHRGEEVLAVLGGEGVGGALPACTETSKKKKKVQYSAIFMFNLCLAHLVLLKFLLKFFTFCSEGFVGALDLLPSPPSAVLLFALFACWLLLALFLLPSRGESTGTGVLLLAVSGVSGMNGGGTGDTDMLFVPPLELSDPLELLLSI